MPRGQKREEAEIAQERLERQQRRVDKLVELVDKLDRELREARIELSNEQTILKYYSQHPALEQPAPHIARVMKWAEDEQLPLRFGDDDPVLVSKKITKLMEREDGAR